VSDLLGERILGKVCPSLVGVVGQGINYQLEVRMGSYGMSCRRHKSDGWIVLSGGMRVRREDRVEGK
jgi:hypothetical protein